MKREDYVSLEVAKLLKEKGFDECCGAYYHCNWDEMTEEECFEVALIHVFRNSNNRYRIGAPTLYEAQKWLRNNHGIAVNTYNRVSTKGISWSYEFNKIETCKSIIDRNSSFIGFDTYEEALNEGILEALKLI